MSYNIQSNALRGDFMRDIVDRTINEIHADMTTVFGPFAMDAFIMKNGGSYYTRDGKEVLQSMLFDNNLSNYINSIIFQAVSNQAKKVGDGTTTVAVFYTNLYNKLRMVNDEFTRTDWITAIDEINAEIKKQSTEMTDEDLKSVLLTCTQDTDLSAKIYDNLHEAIMESAYIVPKKSNIETDFKVDVHTSPLFKVTRQFQVRPVASTELACTILHCNGILDIAHQDVMLDLMSRVIGIPKTIIILCNGISEATRRTTKEVNLTLRKQNFTADMLKQYNNVAIYTLNEYRSYDNEQIEDISTIITDEPGIGGLVNQLTFESLLYQTIHNPQASEIPELMSYDCDTHHIEKMSDILADSYQIDFDDIEGMRIHKELGPVAKKRYEELKTAIQEEKSEVKLVNLRRRLKTMYGQFIDVEIGSKLIKDSQRKYELVLDAITSSADGVEHGVLHANSILIALDAVYRLIQEFEHEDDNERFFMIYQVIYEALKATMIDMVLNGWNCGRNAITSSDDRFVEWFYQKDYARFNLLRRDWNKVLPAVGERLDPDDEDGIPVKFAKIKTEDGETKLIEFIDQIVEPVSIITNMLENTTVALDLVNARTFHLDGFMQNYIE